MNIERYKLPRFCDGQCYCDCEECPCTTCNGYDDLDAFAQAYGFTVPETPDINFPFNYSGTTLSGITVIPGASSTITVQSDGGDTFLEKNTCNNSGVPYQDDDVFMFFDGVAKKDFTFSYDYMVSTATCNDGGKHRLLLATSNSVVTGTGILTIGSWRQSGNQSTAILDLRAEYPTLCNYEYPPPEIPNFSLPQTTNVWTRRTIEKDGEVVTFTDGSYGPKRVHCCWLNLGGYVGMFLGPGVRIRNINISI